MLFLMNLKNNNAKKNLRMVCSQRNITAYPPIPEAIARYLSTQYSNKNSAHQCESKKRDRNGKKGMIPNLKTRTTIPQALQVHTLKMLRHMKTLLLLAEGTV